MPMLTKPPCFDKVSGFQCDKRSVGCKHSCEEWKKYEEEYHKEAAKKSVSKDADIAGYTVRSIDKIKKITRVRR